MHRLFRRLTAALTAVVAALMAVLAVTVATGQVSFVVTHGTSMQPVYYEGDLVVVARASSYEVGQIVAFRQPGRDGLVLHRIIGGDAEGFALKGDNNQSTDPDVPAADQIVGRAVVHIPDGGLWLNRLTSPPVLGLVAFLLLGAGIGGTQVRRRRRRPAMSRHSSIQVTPSALGTLSPPLRVAAAVTAVVGLLALVLGVLAWSSPTSRPVTAEDPPAKKVVFSYSAEVGTSAAYDGTTAYSPDPVFRSLADTVDVHIAYEGAPGSIAVTAELSTAGGWRSSVPLAGAESFTGDTYQDTVQLDLAVIEARAQAASAVTGLPSSPVNIAVIARVETPGDPVFTPALNLVLSAQHLSLAGDPATLTATASPATTPEARTPESLSIFGLDVTVTTARTAAAVALAAALVAAAAVAVFARRSTPQDEGAAIRRRYSQLLIQVRQPPIPPNGQVVDVADFATLARLAERYGLLVMHWADATGQTFVVQDNDITYRYRIPADPRPAGTPREDSPAAVG